MKIIGFNLSKISIIRKEIPSEKIEINQNIDIKDISSEKIPISKDEVLKVLFGFTIVYSSDFAKVEFDGSLILLPEKSEYREIIKSWKDKKIPEEVRIPLFNFIMAKCNVKALSLEDDLALPLHIQLPRLTQKSESNQK